MKEDKEALFITEWKNEMKKRIKLRFANKKLSDKKIDNYLNKLISENMKNPPVTVVNNYLNASVHTDLLSLIDTIRENNLIIGGAGVLFVQHDTPGKLNVLIKYIFMLQRTRNEYKGERKKYEKGTDNWIMFENYQKNTKTNLNSLYGAHGYEFFVLYNRFIAECVTNQGRQIITTAVMTFEAFLSNGVRYNTEEEVYTYITNIMNDYEEAFGEKGLDGSLFPIENIDDKVVKRILDVCEFRYDDEFEITIRNMIYNLSYEEKVLFYYKNNLYDFSRLPFIKDKLKYVIDSLDEFNAPDRKLIKDDEILSIVNELNNFYETFVLYDHPIYDRVRKAMFTDRDSVLYVDTDSNFLGLNRWVQFIKNEVLENQYNKPETNVEFITVNLMALFLENIIDHGLQTLCKYMNVTPEYAKRLYMKNEFYLSRIIFTDAKKRYVSNSILQEGQLLNDGLGLPDIKGFDFKKAGTKPYLRDIYTDICLNDILRADNINVESIYKKVLQLKSDIEESMRKGESVFFKQATVNIIEHYKQPYSTQGVVATLLWNTLNPTYAMELPTDTDIVPIRELTGPKFDKTRGRYEWKNEEFVMEFKDKFPEAYSNLEKNIYKNENELIRNMGLTSLAKPKNSEIVLPEWFEFLLDTNKVTLDALNLISPILKSLGLNGLKTNASTEYMTNIIDL